MEGNTYIGEPFAWLTKGKVEEQEKRVDLSAENLEGNKSSVWKNLDKYLNVGSYCS